MDIIIITIVLIVQVIIVIVRVVIIIPNSLQECFQRRLNVSKDRKKKTFQRV